jgi:hypothetical protein
MGIALALAQIFMSALPTIVSVYEQILGATHPDVVAAQSAAVQLQATHNSAVAAA